MSIEVETIEITVNGEARVIPSTLKLAGLLELLGITADRVAVEVDRRIVRRDRWATTPLEPGARVEIVQFVGGG